MIVLVPSIYDTNSSYVNEDEDTLKPRLEHPVDHTTFSDRYVLGSLGTGKRKRVYYSTSTTTTLEPQRSK